MSGGRDELRRVDAERLALALVAVPPRRMIEVRPAIDELIGARDRAAAGRGRAPRRPRPPHVLVRQHAVRRGRDAAAPAVAHPAHPIARRVPRRRLPPAARHRSRAVRGRAEVPGDEPAAAAAPRHRQRTARRIPTSGKKGFDLTNPADLAALPVPPLWSNVAGSSRLVFRVTNESLLYSEEGLIAAMSVLDLSVAPHAAPPARRPRPKLGRVLRQRSRRHHERARRRERARVPHDRAAGASTRPTGRPTSPRS